MQPIGWPYQQKQIVLTTIWIRMGGSWKCGLQIRAKRIFCDWENNGLDHPEIQKQPCWRIAFFFTLSFTLIWTSLITAAHLRQQVLPPCKTAGFLAQGSWKWKWDSGTWVLWPRHRTGMAGPGGPVRMDLVPYGPLWFHPKSCGKLWEFAKGQNDVYKAQFEQEPMSRKSVSLFFLCFRPLFWFLSMDTYHILSWWIVQLQLRISLVANMHAKLNQSSKWPLLSKLLTKKNGLTDHLESSVIWR